MEHKQYFQISLLEYIIIIKLEEARVLNEIGLLQELYDNNRDKKLTDVHLLNIPQVAKYTLTKNGLESILHEIAGKKQWIDKWVSDEFEKLSRLDREKTSHLKTKVLKELFVEHEGLEASAYRKFLLLQEAIMVPLFVEGSKQIHEEQFKKENLEKLSRLLGLNFDFAKAILTNHSKNLDAITGNWRNTVKVAVIGISILLPFTCVILPVALKALSVLTGISGSAITAEGVANLGTGALAVIDTSNHQMHILIAGGLLFGTLREDLLFSYFNILPKEAIAMICCKTLNLLQFLQSTKQTEIHAGVTGQFLLTKYELEKSLMLKDVDQESLKDLLGKTDILYKTFKRIKTLKE